MISGAAVPSIVIQQSREVPYPLYLQLAENIKIKFPGQVGRLTPTQCFYDGPYSPRYIDEEGVLHFEANPAITCFYRDSSGRVFSYVFAEKESRTIKKAAFQAGVKDGSKVREGIANGTIAKSDEIERLTKEAIR
jgi:hypothetical protein